MAAIEPMNQFLVHKIVPIPVEIPGVGTLDLSITNSVAFMLVSAGVLAIFFLAAARQKVVLRGAPAGPGGDALRPCRRQFDRRGHR